MRDETNDELWKLEHARAEDAERRIAETLKRLEVEHQLGRIANRARDVLKGILTGTITLTTAEPPIP